MSCGVPPRQIPGFQGQTSLGPLLLGPKVRRGVATCYGQLHKGLTVSALKSKKRLLTMTWRIECLPTRIDWLRKQKKYMKDPSTPAQSSL